MERVLLLIDDSDTDRLAIRRMLENGASVDLKIVEVDSGEAALTCMDDTVACILLDYQLSDMSGLDFLRMAMVQAPVGVVVVTGISDPEVGFDSYQQGVDDFVQKDTMSRGILVHAIRNAMHKARLRDREQQHLNRLQIFHALFNQSDELLLVLDLKTEKILDYNEAVRRLLLRGRPEMDDQDITAADVFAASRDAMRQLRAQIIVTESGVLDTDLIAGDGRRVPVQIKGRRVSVGAQDYVVAAIRDVSAQRRLERELVRTRFPDLLTGLGNAQAALEFHRRFTLESASSTDQVGVLAIGLDRAEDIDRVMEVEAAQTLRRHLWTVLDEAQSRANEVLSSWDQDRLVLVTRGMDAATLNTTAESIRHTVMSLARVNPADGRFVSVSVGCVLAAPQAEIEAERHIDRALELLARAQARGEGAIETGDVYGLEDIRS